MKYVAQLISACLIYFPNLVSGQQNLFLTQLNTACDTIQVQTWVWFTFGYQATCPALSFYNINQNSDTLELKLFYNITGVWPQVGCERWDTILLAVPAGVNVLKGIAHSINDSDTTQESCASIELCNLESINESENKVALNVYPNPTNGTINVIIDDWSVYKGHDIEVYNFYGQIISKKAIDTSSIEMNLGNISPGVYMVKIPGKSCRVVIKQN